MAKSGYEVARRCADGSRRDAVRLLDDASRLGTDPAERSVLKALAASARQAASRYSHQARLMRQGIVLDDKQQYLGA